MLAVGLGIFASVALFRFSLSWLNLKHQQRQGHRVPAELASEVDADRLAKINAYTVERIQLGLVRSLVGQLVVGSFVFLGVLGLYDAWVSRMSSSQVWGGALFFAGLSLASALAEAPFELWSDFRLEARHAFNRKTRALWLSDWLKGTLLSVAFTALLAAAALALVVAAPQTWWLWVSALLVGVSLLMTFLSPYLIEPLFYRMEPLQVEGLTEGVRALTQRAGVQVKRVLKVDASRRSSHSNAYFTGLGRVKRVVLFDTLLTQMTHPQILAILAHELGHWKKRHVLSRMFVMLALLVLTSYLLSRFVAAPWVPQLVGMAEASLPARALILFLFGSLCAYPLTPFFSWWSRRHEREADAFAVELHREPRDLADALAKLGRENLASLHPHPLYAAFYYSHPPLPERIAWLRAIRLPEAAHAV